MAGPYTIADLVAEVLALSDVSTAFGIASVHNIPLLDAIGRRNQIRFVMTRGEMGAGHMADGYVRASGRLAALISSTGPGAANAASALLEARTAGTPMLHLTGNVPTKLLDLDGGSSHAAPDQLAMLKSVSKAAYRMRKPEQALGLLTQAVVEALTPPMGPVSVEIPIDLQRASVPRPALLDHYRLPQKQPLIPPDEEFDELVSRVLAASRPMIWLGSGARDAGKVTEQFLDLGFGLVTSWAGRGAVAEDHPMTLGAMNGNGIESIEEFYKSVDLMLVVGSRLRGQETLDFTLPLPARRIQIDINPAANGRTYASDFFVCGDARTTLELLYSRIHDRCRIDAGFPAELRALKHQARAEYRLTLGAYADFAEQLRRAAPRDSIFARDITLSNHTWGHRLFELYGPRDNIYPILAGIGQGVPLGIGASIAANGRKTIIMTGDGGFNLNLSEIWTAVQENVNAVIIVMNDGGYAAIKYLQDAASDGRRFFWELNGPKLEELAQLAGLPFWKVSAADGFGAAVSDALQVDGPALVEVNMAAIGEFPRFYPFAPKAPRLQRRV